MFKEVPVCKAPLDPNGPIWRYMDFNKFSDIVTTQELYLPRADRFRDQFEGLVPHLTKGNWPNVTEWIRGAKRQTFVSCWQLNTHESELMWHAYTKDNDGVVIETSYHRLIDALSPCPDPIFIGTVKYIDFETDTLTEWRRDPNIYAPILYKRMEFKADQEIRIFLNTMSNRAIRARNENENAVRIPIDVNALIERVRLRPQSSADFSAKVINLLADNGLKKSVISSSLDKMPP